MKTLKLATRIFCIAFMGAILTPAVQADEWNRKTVITFSAPVKIPGVHLTGWGVLPAGTYLFKILDSQSDRHVVQVFDKAETIIYATILAIPNYRLQATDETVMTFRERPAGQPEALRAWFYPGRNWGEEFVYPKSRAVELAKAGNVPVLFTPVDLPLEVTVPIKASAAEPVVMELKRAPIMAIQPTDEEVPLAVVVTPPPAEQVAAVTPAAGDELPATGSSLPLIGSAGLMALPAAFAVRIAAAQV